MLWRSTGTGPRVNLPGLALLRVAPVLCLYGLAMGLWQYGQQHGPAPLPRWTHLPPAGVVQGDALYRGGLGLQAALERAHQDAGAALDPEDLMQAGLGAYERLGLPKENPDPAAMLRLAVIYSARGYPEQGRELLQRLVQTDERQAPLYLALSGIYDSRQLRAAEVREAWELLAKADPWPAHLALPELYRRAGDEQGARAAEAEVGRRSLAFSEAALWVLAVYLLVGLTGAALVLRWIWVSLFRLPKPGVDVRPGPTRWEPLDALEAAGVVLLAAVVLGQISAALGRRWELPTRAPVLDGALALVVYLLVMGSALWVVRYRVARTTRQPLRKALGLGGLPDRQRVWQGVAGYCALLGTAGLAGALARSWGLPLATVGGPTSGAVALYAVMTCGLAPLLEEAVFRGYVFAGLRRAVPVPMAAICSALLFAGGHLSLSGAGLVAVVGMGVMLAYLYERTGSVWPCVVAHTLHNLLALSIILVLNS